MHGRIEKIYFWPVIHCMMGQRCDPWHTCFIVKTNQFQVITRLTFIHTRAVSSVPSKKMVH